MAPKRDLEQEARKTRMGYLFETGAKAAGVVGGAVLFHRAGGTRALETGVSFARDFLVRGTKELGAAKTSQSRQGLGNFSREALTGVKKAWSESINNQRNLGPIKPRFESSFRSVVDVVHQYNQFTENKKKTLSNLYDNERILPEFMNRFSSGLNETTGREAEGLQSFYKDAVKKLGYRTETDTVALEPIKSKLQGTGLEQQADEMLDFIAESMKTKKKEIDLFTQERENIIRDLADRLVDPESLKKRFGSLGKDSWAEKILGDRPATVDEILAYSAERKVNLTSDAVENAEEVLRRIRSREDIGEAFGEVYFDRSIRIKNGEIYSTRNVSNIAEKIQREIGTTLPGKIFRTESWLKGRKSPLAMMINAGNVDPVLIARLTGQSDNLAAQEQLVRIHDSVYKFGAGGLEHIKELDNLKLAPRGTRQRIIGQMAGSVDTREESAFGLFRKLDIGQAGAPTVLDKVGGIFKKYGDPSWAREAGSRFLDFTDESLVRAVNDPSGYLESIRTIDRLFGNSTRSLNKNTAELIRDSLSDAVSQQGEHASRARPYFDLLTLDDDNFMSELTRLSKFNNKKFMNHDLIGLMNRYTKDPREAMSTMSTKVRRGGGVMEMRDQVDFFELVRKEVAKEGFLQHHSQNADKGYNSLVDLIEDALKNTESARNARLLAHWAAFQNTSKSYKNISGEQTTSDFLDTISNTATLFHAPSDDKAFRFSQSFRKEFKQILKENTSALESSGKTLAETYQPTSFNEWVHVAKTVTPLDLLKNLNDKEKWKAFGGQFTAGRHRPGDITEATMVPFFFMNRMSDALNTIGLGFSARSTGSNQQLLGSIVGKRILPAAVGLGYLGYANDMMGELTGTELKGHLANNIAHMDLGMRRIGDITGLSGIYAREKEINPLLQYWAGKDEYQDYDERREWYQKGYSPVRKSRWWNFGSLNEFRGGQISYFQPNYLRRAHSDWLDESLYDSTWEKWSRHPLPTPTAPLSTLSYLWNPYWLEEKHMENRPYPLSGKLFSEETPWGAVLNPTLGRIIKPQREYHQDRLGVQAFDVKLLIEERNMAAKQKALNKESGGLIRAKEGHFEPVRYTPMGAPTDTERVLGVNHTHQSGGLPTAGGLSYTGYGDYGEPVPEIKDIHGATKLSNRTRLSLAAAEGSIVASLAEQMLPVSLSRQMAQDSIAQANAAIFAKARINEQEGAVTPESIFRTQARYSQNILYNREALADLRNINAGGEAMTDVMYSARYLSGIYGYMAHVFTPTPKEYRLANANAMTSVSRRLWDESVGGLAGPAAGPFEIVRRFLTVQNRYVEHVNPLMNTMPDWMPMRFRTGDAYSVVPKGEMRLPGKGYESLHNLNPDIFGIYGSFDRMKILADVAPFSDEYRQWRDIASRTVQDPELKLQMQEIRQRVTEQSKANDFYPYRFLGQSLEYKEAVVDEVINNNYFTVVGSNERFRMAGISVSQTEDGENVLNQFLQPGMSIRIGLDANEHYRRNEDAFNSLNAAVQVDGQNLNRQLLDIALAQRREDVSAAGSIGLHSDTEVGRGKMYELLTHANIPIIQDKYMRIRSPLEKYKSEHIYGTPFASWRYPIDSYLKPAMEKAISSDMNMLIGTLAWVGARQAEKHDVDKGIVNGLNLATALTNRGALVGGFIGYGMKLGGSSYVKHGANIGAVASIAGYMYTRRDQPVQSTLSSAALGAAAMKAIGQDQLMGKAAGVAALLALAINGVQNSVFEKEDRLNMIGKGVYIPKRIEDRWEIQEYFDRLKYIKYSGLYEKASRRARLFEGTNIKAIMREYDLSEKEREELRADLLRKRETLGNIFPEGDERAMSMTAEIDQTLANIDASQNMYLRGGKHTRTAIAYKQAMESTIYGLREDATWSQILRALPRNDRDYFMEFSKERDPEKREEILQYVSPYMARALRIAWGEKPGRLQSNHSYFQAHRLPSPTWSGWRPDTDLDDIQAKTVYNEGMMLSDFGFYDSQLRDPDVIDAPYLEMYEPTGPIQLQKNLLGALKGMGLFGVKVDVQPSNRNGVEVIADVSRVMQYDLQQKFDNTLGRLL